MREMQIEPLERPKCKRMSLVARQTGWLVLFLVVASGAQNSSLWQQKHQVTGNPDIDREQPNDPNDSQSESRLRALNAERQKSLVSDTNKILKLAGELETEVGGANPELPTPGQLRKVAEIEKLARNVKEKMSTSVRTIPVFRPPSIGPDR